MQTQVLSYYHSVRRRKHILTLTGRITEFLWEINVHTKKENSSCVKLFKEIFLTLELRKLVLHTH
jgi:hypothetical protein